MAQLSPSVAKILSILLGDALERRLMLNYGPQIVSFVYWWGIPLLQLLGALLVMDTWQYFLHRAFHLNTFLYRRFHSVHHRLYVPYAFGALYNHWFEGLLLDSLGTAIAEKLTFMSVRQAAFLFTFSTLKTVDDHCGYALPWDPFQILFGNNAVYHDIHHRTWGTKHNFSQPFFVHFDVLFGTRYDGPPPVKKKAKTA
jgi:sphinganine C4-monooxygenase